MNRILVFQTTRMGDVLQTSPLIRGIRRKYPGASITVMLRGMGQAIAERNPDVDDIIVYDEDDIFLNLRAKDSDRLLRAYQAAEDYIGLLKSKHFDLAYNCTHSLSSAMLLKLAEIPEVVGAHVSDDWQFVLRGRWINYFFTSVFHRECNDLNLCDITRHFVSDGQDAQQLVFEVQDEDRAFVQGLMDEHGVTPDTFVACFQLGASEESKRWTEKRFAELARMLLEKQPAKIFLLGVDSEAPLGEVFEKHAPGMAVPLYGKTTIAQVAALLERAGILVTNDTGTMHIAAAVGCPIALVSVGYVHFRETGPYGAGHCAIEWRRPRIGSASHDLSDTDERSQIRPEHVMRAIDLVLDSSESLPRLDPAAELTDVDLFVTRFAADGCLQWYPAIRRAITEMDLSRIAYRAMWLDYLGAQTDKRTERNALEQILGCYTSPTDGSIADWQQGQDKVFDGFAQLARNGVQITQKLLDVLDKGGGMRKAQLFVAQLMALDEDMRVFSELHHSCRPLVRIARYERDNLEGADPNVLARTTLQIYRDGFARARMMQKKIGRVAEVWAAQASGQ